MRHGEKSFRFLGAFMRDDKYACPLRMMWKVVRPGWKIVKALTRDVKSYHFRLERWRKNNFVKYPFCCVRREMSIVYNLCNWGWLFFVFESNAMHHFSLTRQFFLLLFFSFRCRAILGLFVMTEHEKFIRLSISSI